MIVLKEEVNNGQLEVEHWLVHARADRHDRAVQVLGGRGESTVRRSGHVHGTGDRGRLVG